MIADRQGHGVLVEQEGDPPGPGGQEHPGDVRRPSEPEQLRLQDLRLRVRA